MLLKKKYTIQELMLCLVGLFSTFSIIRFGGVTAFNLISLLALIVFFAFELKIPTVKDKILIALIIALCMTEIISYCGQFTNIGYRNNSLTTFILLLIVGLLSLYISRRNKYVAAYIRGFDLSCKVQLIWCVIQIVLYNIFSIDINRTIFSYLTTASQYRNGTLVCTGLHWHAANMIPILIYVYLKTDKFYLKIITIALTIFTQNSKAIIAIILCATIDILKYLKKLNRGRVNRKYIFVGMLAIVAVIASGNILAEIFSSISQRFIDINSTVGGNSSATHFSYYTHLPYVITHNTILENLFGFGLSSSGYVYSKYFGQYAGQIWTVESDVVNSIVSYGLIGSLIFITFLVILAVKGLKIDFRYFEFVLVLVIVGIFYNVQFTWTIFLEMVMYVSIKRGNNVFENELIVTKKKIRSA